MVISCRAAIPCTQPTSCWLLVFSIQGMSCEVVKLLVTLTGNHHNHPIQLLETSRVHELESKNLLQVQERKI